MKTLAAVYKNNSSLLFIKEYGTIAEGKLGERRRLFPLRTHEQNAAHLKKEVDLYIHFN